MQSAPPQFDLAFRGSWRDYQQRVLDELDGHLVDDRLHVVAAPGSGKTILGLEVMRRIGRPAIVLAPTVTIRNQWVDRLTGLFRPEDAPHPDWISASLAAPARLTVTTYQALHACWSTEPPDTPETAPEAAAPPGAFDRLIAAIIGLGPATIILDEAHHLRREWWRALQALTEALPGVALVSLTATPPYDVEATEWTRYEALCGPIDTEISTPELVRNGDLCPHQDYLHVSLPAMAEATLIADRRAGLYDLVTALQRDAAFAEALLEHPWLTKPLFYEELILADPEFLSAMLIFLRASGHEPPRAPIKLLGVRAADMPPMSLPWLEALLTGVLFDQYEAFPTIAPRIKDLRATLQRLGAIENRRVRLMESQALFSAMAGSVAKIDSICAIARAEIAAAGPALRMVVLADHVRAGDLLVAPDAPFRPTKLGVASIFEALRREGITGTRLGVLTGTLVVVPESALGALRTAIAEELPEAMIRFDPLRQAADYLQVIASGDAAQHIVEIVTRLFGAGEINVLVDTQALLGEGWDAPSIDTLVLASNVGSYMLSNQMRGRALRIDPARPGKVANIWHLATIDPGLTSLSAQLVRDFHWSAMMPPHDPIGQPLGPDMALLKRRFQAFEGVLRDDGNAIESGLDRLRLYGRDWSANGIADLNREMLAGAAARDLLPAKWQAALYTPGEHWPRMRQVARTSYAPRMIAVADTLQYFVVSAILGGIGAAANAMRQVNSLSTLSTALFIFAGVASLYALPRLGWAAWLFVRNGTVERSLAQVCEVLLDSLDHADLLQRSPQDYQVTVEPTLAGKRLITLLGGNRAEERRFMEALSEILGPVGNPRYLLERRSWLGRRRRIDYHAIPSVIGQHKGEAEYFAMRWRARIGHAKLVYTRTAPGRRILLEARAGSLAAGFQRFVDRMSAWR